MMEHPIEIATVGHSNITVEAFVALLTTHNVTAIADVRSTPYSRYTPQFSRETLQATLKAAGITYVFLGDELGARSKNPECYTPDGQVVYARIAETSLFRTGIDRVMRGAQTYRLSLMCAERDPLDCHRTLLVAQALVTRGAVVSHIMHNGNREQHEQTLQRMDAEYLKQHQHQYGVVAPTLWELASPAEHAEAVRPPTLRAYALAQLEAKIAYRKPGANTQEVEDRG